ncbi:DUF3500 domain-containing protein [Conexibacter sp. CPCC 206217]|uniref:DUF3500 domain-containing protein n=1 Tax=Conexibacter sp. CPCC 206217 TaxID=3064574 RepID=UPI002720E512|nr:DUF3500 domain-containing protein [Conexibacter sp. CPCC 206217]MDO8210134.1 DUF3500 domain-containing protein [Conexibacter sp. CPCC 206217]
MSGSAITSDYQAATLMTFSAMALFDALDPQQRRRVVVPFAHDNRRHWRFLPESGRGDWGISLREMSWEQQILAHRLIAASVSHETYAQVLATFSLEHLLRELDERRLGHVAPEFRHPGNYFLTFFGQPQPDTTWGWRLVGHHVSLNFTSVGQEWISPTPLLIGAEPARFGVFRTLAQEEDLAFALLRTLDDEQRAQALIHDVAPADFVTRTVPVLGSRELPDRHGVGRRDVVIEDADREALWYERERPRGVAYAALTDAQQAAFRALLDCYVARVHPLAREREARRIERAGIGALHFAWAGATDCEGGHYYRVQGPVTLIEFNNTEDEANHAHSVWRDPVGDFGGAASDDATPRREDRG